MNGSAQVVHGDARNLEFLADESVDLIVTSPPYFALRSYRDGDEHYDGQIGSEATPDDFIDALTACMDEWRRVLKPSGSVWVNLGDKYANDAKWGGASNAKQSKSDDPTTIGYRQKLVTGMRPKSLMGLPWRFAIACIDAGWILRAEVIWSKPNGLPESVTDRVRRSHEQWFHFTKEPRYFAAVDEVREPHAVDWSEGRPTPSAGARAGEAIKTADSPLRFPHPLGRLPGSVWTIPTEPLIVPDHIGVDHFAAFPTEWPRRIILGWSPNGVCVECGEGRRPVVEKEAVEAKAFAARQQAEAGRQWGQGDPSTRTLGVFAHERNTTITGYACACPTPDAPTRPAVVLDPFGGTGTVAGVARALGRHGISVDLSRDYCRLAEWRIFESGHFDKTLKRSMADKQGTLL